MINKSKSVPISAAITNRNIKNALRGCVKNINESVKNRNFGIKQDLNLKLARELHSVENKGNSKSILLTHSIWENVNKTRN